MRYVLFISCVMLAGCAVGPDFQKPAAPKVNGYTSAPLSIAGKSGSLAGSGKQALVTGQDILAQWWKLFGSKPLDDLIEESLKANPNVQAAEAALRVANENVKAQQGFYYPTVVANPNVTRQGIASSLPGTDPLSTGQLTFNLYTAQVGVSYTPDVFGLNKRTVESLQAQAEAQRYQLAAAYLTLSSNVVVAAIQEAALREEIAATHNIINLNTDMLKILRNQFAKGSASRLDVAAQESLLAQVTATLPPLEKQLAQVRDLLTALAGRYSSDEITQKFELTGLHLPQDLPLSLPSQLVEQRPDILTAEEQLHSASAQIGVAVANRLPQITLDASGGYAGTLFRTLLDPADRFWSLGAGVTQPIFDGGTLSHRETAARATYDQAYAQYRSTVVTAFQNVADTLHALKSDADALNADVAALDAANATLDLTKRQLQSGSVNYLAMLNAQQAYQQAKINLIQAQANRFADTAALFQALGGGWWNMPDPQIVSKAGTAAVTPAP